MSIPVVKNLVPSNKYSIKCPYTMNAEYITIHNTANDASARNEIAYMIRNNGEVSYHFAVDDKEVVQGIPVNRNAWHCGDGFFGTGNRKSIGVEICYSKSGGERYKKAEQNAIKFIAQLLYERGWGIDRVRTHQQWSGKYCPHRILSEGRLNQVLKAIGDELDKLKNPVKEQPKEVKEVKEELKFFRPASREIYEKRKISPATKQLLVETAVKDLGYKQDWITYHEQGKLLEGDYIALAFELAVYHGKYEDK